MYMYGNPPHETCRQCGFKYEFEEDDRRSKIEWSVLFDIIVIYILFFIVMFIVGYLIGYGALLYVSPEPHVKNPILLTAFIATLVSCFFFEIVRKPICSYFLSKLDEEQKVMFEDLVSDRPRYSDITDVLLGSVQGGMRVVNSVIMMHSIARRKSYEYYYGRYVPRVKNFGL
jgi:hypothetical protein